MAKFKVVGEDGATSEIEAFTADEVKSMIASEVTGLKAKRDELLEETKGEREKRVALELEKEESARLAAVERGEFEKLYNGSQSELEAERTANREFKSSIEQRDISAKAMEIGRSLAPSHEKRAATLSEYASKLAKMENGEMVFEIGGVRVDQGKVVEHLTSEYDFLVDGSQASGGGAQGGGGGAAATSGTNGKAEAAKAKGDLTGFISASLESK